MPMPQVSQAVWHSSHRAAFGARLVEQPAMRGVLADLAVESEAATFTVGRSASLFAPVGCCIDSTPQ